MAAWSGIRPLVTDPSSKDTQSISRNHVVAVSDSGLVTIAGTGNPFQISHMALSGFPSVFKSKVVNVCTADLKEQAILFSY